ncbi:Uncharacterised protein [Mycobacteroides abscessus subsp. bolletii]|uniref:hypothetical protein n=1 Tax=Rothia sp. P100 TaxID=2939578 RepID=UPI0009D15768|nr:hypothetical protein [Rothia sp. P100]MCM3509202.1 hypothetical protein [Rothia sp. P100]SLE55448.1 Uncharacterised protein [Mycobacteroides abscessus subsp. bolletii]
MSEQWIPLGVRLGVQEPVALKNGFLEDEATSHAAREWLVDVIYHFRSDDLEPLIGACGIPTYKNSNGVRTNSERVLRYSSTGEIQLLNTLEFLAAKIHDSFVVSRLNSLCLHYNVNWRFDFNSRRLARRVLPETQEHYLNLARSVSESCSEYLQQAFTNAYGHNGTPAESWVASRKAVEFLLHPVVSPSNTRATISSMIRDIKSAPHKWVSAIPANDPEQSVLKFVQLLQMMPYEPGHHGQTPGQVSLDQARTQFNLALTVCQMVLDGGFALADS